MTSNKVYSEVLGVRTPTNELGGHNRGEGKEDVRKVTEWVASVMMNCDGAAWLSGGVARR